jgi:hypothetical protein
MPKQGPEVHEMMRVLANMKVGNLPDDVVFFMQKHLLTCSQCQSSMGREQVQAFINRNIEEIPEKDEFPLLPACGITRYYQSLEGEETPNDLQESINAHIRLCSDCDTVTRRYAQLTLGLQNLPDPLPRMAQLHLPPRHRQQQHHLRTLLIIVVVVIVVLVAFFLLLHR